MTANEFSGRVHHNISTEVDGLDQVGSAESAVDNQG